MFSLCSALVYISAIWVNHLNKEKERMATIDLSLMVFAFIGDIILAVIIF